MLQIMSLRSFSFALVDAFTSKPLAGNPCAVVMGAEGLDSETMLRVAKEMNQSETAFLMRSEKADLRARYFTPEREIPLAGHPTIASIHIALETGFLKLRPGSTEISLELKDGPIHVGLDKNSDGLMIRMFQRKPQFLETHDPAVVLPLFGLDASDLMAGAPIQTVSTGTPQLMVPLKSHESLKKLSMNVPAYREYREKMGFFSPHLFALGGATHQGHTFARHPGVAPDTLEDSFTGSATGGMAAFLYKYDLLPQLKEDTRFVAEQGHWMGRPGVAFVEIIESPSGSPRDIASVVVAGQAVTTVLGTLQLSKA